MQAYLFKSFLSVNQLPHLLHHGPACVQMHTKGIRMSGWAISSPGAGQIAA